MLAGDLHGLLPLLTPSLVQDVRAEQVRVVVGRDLQVVRRGDGRRSQRGLGRDRGRGGRRCAGEGLLEVLLRVRYGDGVGVGRGQEPTLGVGR